MQDNYALVVIVPIALKDEVIDTLMALEDVSGFSMTEIAGYSREHAQFSQREQVAGYRNLHRFEVLHTSEQKTLLLQALEPICKRAHSRYWITPVVESGHFGI